MHINRKELIFKINEEMAKSLINAAKAALIHAFTGFSQIDIARFGAAVMTKKGNIYSSGQYFSDTLSLTLHAEQGAIAHAAAHGEYEIAAITCVGNEAAYKLSEGIIYPCHLCKQLLWESHLRSGVDTEIIIIDASNEIIECLQISQVMNHPWPIKKIRD